MITFRSHLRNWAATSLLVVAMGLLGCGGRPLLPSTQQETESTTSGDFTDSFIPGQTSNWLFEQDELASTGIANEQLVISIAAPNTIQYAMLPDKTFSDFILEVDAWQRSGSLESSYGVLFRMQDGQQFYRFDITGNGLYMIERRGEDGIWTRLVPDWTPTSAINQGLNVANRLKVLAAGSSLTFYVNDVLLSQVNDPTYSAGSVALDAGTFGGGNLQVSFDNLGITSSVR